MNRKSKAIGTILLMFLWFGAVLSVLALICTMIYVQNIDVYLTYFDTIDTFIMTFYSILYMITIVIYIIWIFNVHVDLNSMDKTYTISPKGSLARILIPFYNLWGLWNVYSTMAAFFMDRSPTKRLAVLLSRSIPFLYFVLFFNRVMTKLTGDPTNVPDKTWILANIADLATMIVFLLMTTAIVKSLNYIEDNIYRVKNEASEEVVQ